MNKTEEEEGLVKEEVWDNIKKKYLLNTRQTEVKYRNDWNLISFQS